MLFYISVFIYSNNSIQYSHCASHVVKIKQQRRNKSLTIILQNNNIIHINNNKLNYTSLTLTFEVHIGIIIIIITIINDGAVVLGFCLFNYFSSVGESGFSK